MSTFTAIIPGVGLQHLKFGYTRDQVEAILGWPSRRERDDPGYESWHYDSHDLYLSFCEESEWRMVAFESEHPELSVLGVNVVGMEHIRAMTELANQGLTGATIVVPIVEGEFGLHYRAESLHLWVEEWRVTSVSAGVTFSDDDEEQWP